MSAALCNVCGNHAGILELADVFDKVVADRGILCEKIEEVYYMWFNFHSMPNILSRISIKRSLQLMENQGDYVENILAEKH